MSDQQIEALSRQLDYISRTTETTDGYITEVKKTRQEEFQSIGDSLDLIDATLKSLNDLLLLLDNS
jgi:uncharacterized protein (DUF2267 family)